MKKYTVYISCTTYARGTYEAESEEEAIEMCREDEKLSEEFLRNLQECEAEVEEIN